MAWHVETGVAGANGARPGLTCRAGGAGIEAWHGLTRRTGLKRRETGVTSRLPGATRVAKENAYRCSHSTSSNLPSPRARSEPSPIFSNVFHTRAHAERGKKSSRTLIVAVIFGRTT